MWSHFSTKRYEQKHHWYPGKTSNVIKYKSSLLDDRRIDREIERELDLDIDVDVVIDMKTTITFQKSLKSIQDLSCDDPDFSSG